MPGPDFGDKPISMWKFLELADKQKLHIDRSPEAKKKHAFAVLNDQNQIIGYGDRTNSAGSAYKFEVAPQSAAPPPTNTPLPPATPAPRSLYESHAVDPITRPMSEKFLRPH